MGKVSQEQVNGLISRQMNDWSLAGDNYAALAGVKVKRFEVNGREVQVQFNPARIVSSAAKVDDKSLSERRCFLCAANRPVEQEGLAWGDLYTILVNPFPIFPRHLTIPSNDHKPQRIKGRIGDMLGLAADLHDFVIFYNGPKCGASAPDHCHFQAGSKGLMSLPAGKVDGRLIKGDERAGIYRLLNWTCQAFIIKATEQDAAADLFNQLYAVLPIHEGEDEPMLNLLCWTENKSGITEWNIGVFPRVKHRPSCYFAEGDSNILLTPASVDMGGVFITPLAKDFNKIKASDIEAILKEVCYDEDAMNEIENKIII
ncbi:MAG: DUF4922 domain-containing protein [Muribaculaceae bacterium]|jgi:hypothetical protein|nr:DUF4922 domain-containing protein [Muribaculaceae bacterium]